MHPILFEIQLPHWQVPLLWVLLGGAALGVLVALLGWRTRTRDVAILGTSGALLGLLFGIRMRGESFTVTDLPIYGYGTLLAFAFMLGWIVSVRLAIRSGVLRTSAASAFFATSLAALAGSRLLYVLTNLRQFDSVGDALDVHAGGLVAYGGFLGGLLGAWIHGRISGNGLLTWADCAAPAVALGLFLTRIGCYLFGCDFGKPLGDQAPVWLRRVGTFPRWELPSLPLGTGAPAWQRHVQEGLIDFDAATSLPVHPTQLYESCVGLVLFLGLLWVYHRRRFSGQVLLTLGATYGTARFVLELWRDDPERGAMGPAWPVEIGVAAALLIIGISVAVGPVRQLPRSGWRRVAQGLVLLPSPIGYWLARPASAGPALDVQWSTSQWLGLITAVAACLAWVWLARTGAAAIASDAEEAAEDEPTARAGVAASSPSEDSSALSMSLSNQRDP